MKELNQLKQELNQILDNIQRVEKYVEEDKKRKWASGHSHVVGELKHRCIALKTTLTRVRRINTYDLVR